MQQQTADRDRDAGERTPQRTDSAQEESGQKSKEKQNVAPCMSVEEHLAGLWKVLGLGD